MRWRLGILKEHGLGLKEIQAVISRIDPLPGAKAFLDELRKDGPVIILSDTFEQFAAPLIAKLGYPVRALKSIGYDVIAFGDSYNDLGMIREARTGFFFRTTEALRTEFPDIPAFEDYDKLLEAIREAY